MNESVLSLGVGLAMPHARAARDAAPGPFVRYLSLSQAGAQQCGSLPRVVHTPANWLEWQPARRHAHIAELRRDNELGRLAWHAAPASMPVTQALDERLTCGRAALRKLRRTVSAPLALYAPPATRSRVLFAQLDRAAKDLDCYTVLDLDALHRHASLYSADPRSVLAGMELDRVLEVQIANGRPPLPDLLRYVLLACPNLGGVTLMPVPDRKRSPAATTALTRQLAALWARYQPLPSRIAS